ncbi:MAG: potassium channel family protein [Mariprofundaceae bacterium]|nr:potassium channel family protein [Mariprofundaceae bacterium]
MNQSTPEPRTSAYWYRRFLGTVLILSTLLVLFVSMWEGAAAWMQVASLALFLLFFVLDAHASGDWMHYLRKNWFDLFLIVIMTMPLLRLLMLFNLVGLLPAIRIGSLVHMHRKRLLDLIVFSQDSFPVAMALVCTLIFIFGLAGYAFEHAVNPAFATLDDALWWAVVTLTTVGYGDIVPMTGGGRIVAVLNMVFGVLIYSLVIANFTSLIERHSETQKETDKN